jgi:hypothetical protein
MQVNKNYDIILFYFYFVYFKERNNNNNNTPPTMNKAGPPSPGFSKDFEYLIRRELDIDHAPSTLNRNSKFYYFVFQESNHLYSFFL